MKRFAFIGKRLQKLRGHLSQRDFSKRIGVPYTTYQRYESGERMPKDDVLFRVSSICEMPIDWILTGEESSTRSYVRDPDDLKELIDLENRPRKTKKNKARIDEIYDKAYREFIRQNMYTEGEELTDEDEERLLKNFRNDIAEVKIKDKEPSTLLLLDLIGRESILYKMYKQLERIYLEGDKNKIEDIKEQLQEYDPG